MLEKEFRGHYKMNKELFLRQVIKARYLKGKALNKKELNDIFSGIKAMGNLGAFDKPKENWKGENKTQSIRAILKGEDR